MTWTIVVAYCIVDDLLKVLGHRDDPQSKTPASVVLTMTLWILAALEHGGRQNKALQRSQELGLFSFVPSRSRFNRRLHALSYLIPHPPAAAAVQNPVAAAGWHRALHPGHPALAGIGVREHPRHALPSG
nr:hypothetical protein [Calidithermus chliarophilus]